MQGHSDANGGTVLPLTEEEILQILRLVDASDLAEVEIETQGLRVIVRRGGVPAIPPVPAQAPPAEAPSGTPPDPQPRPPVPGRADEEATLAIRAPLMGTFYQAPSPGARPFVAVGALVEKDTVVCIIEVMKLLQSVPAGVRGIVRAICVQDGQMVEEGQTLFLVEPQG